MLFTTPTQFAVLALCVVAGWIFGLATHPGGKRAKARVRELEAEHAAYRKDAEARIKTSEVERDRLARATPVVAPATVTTTDGVRAQSAARPVDRV